MGRARPGIHDERRIHVSTSYPISGEFAQGLGRVADGRRPMLDGPVARAFLLGLSAAALFGASAPLAKLLLEQVPPLTLSALLYLGAGGAVSLALALRRTRPQPLGRDDWRLVLAIALLGGALAPLLMLTGMRQVAGVSGSLMLNLEAPLTILLATTLFGEHITRRAALGAGFVVLGAVAVQWVGGQFELEWRGALLIASACALWAVDNNLSQRLSKHAPLVVVRAKALAAGTTTLAVSVVSGESLPLPASLFAGLAIGAMSYGLSLVLDMQALRLLGAARQAAVFATAPFFGAALSLPILDEPLRSGQLIGAIFMATGIALLARDRHSHFHTHPELEHDHLHEHDEHHRHDHAEVLAGPHSHPHRHTELTHDHPHVSDLHHRHEHD